MCLSVGACATPTTGLLAVSGDTAARLRPPGQGFPTEATFPDGYGRTWDATVAVLASRGFPLTQVARDAGVLQTGWQITAFRYEARLAGTPYYGRKAERLTVLVRPLAKGTVVSVSAQAALVSPEWSAAGTPAPGQAADVPDDTITDYGILHDLGRVLRHALGRAPDPGYPGALQTAGIFATGVKAEVTPPPAEVTPPPATRPGGAPKGMSAPPPPPTAGGSK